METLQPLDHTILKKIVPTVDLVPTHILQTELIIAGTLLAKNHCSEILSPPELVTVSRLLAGYLDPLQFLSAGAESNFLICQS